MYYVSRVTSAFICVQEEQISSCKVHEQEQVRVPSKEVSLDVDITICPRGVTSICSAYSTS